MKIKKRKEALPPYRPPPKKHNGIKCKVSSCGVWSYYIKDKCWLCGTTFKIGK